MPVREAEDKQPVEAGTVYFAPPDYHLLVDVGPTLALSADEAVNFSRPSIDVLFESAADIYGHRLLAMILTGASHDGAAGIDAIRCAGGCAVVQRPDTAQAPLMPESALKRGPVDFVLTLEEIAALFQTLDAGAPGRCINQPMTFAMPMPVKCLLVDDRDENLLVARGAAAPRGRGGADGAFRGARPSICSWRTTSRWHCSTCRCRKWTASSSPS